MEQRYKKSLEHVIVICHVVRTFLESILEQVEKTRHVDISRRMTTLFQGNCEEQPPDILMPIAHIRTASNVRTIIFLSLKLALPFWGGVSAILCFVLENTAN